MNSYYLHTLTKKIIKVLLAVVLCACLVSCSSSYDAKKDSASAGASTIKNATNVEGEPSLFDEVIFGKYEQDGDLNNGSEDVVWQIIDFDDDSLLLLSKYVIDVGPYDEKIDIGDEVEACTWESSYLREYLNDPVYNIMFDDKEKESILLSNVPNGKVYGANNSDVPVDAGADTEDNIYILSKDEIRKYLGFELDGKNESYMTKLTPFAKTWIHDGEEEDGDFAIWHKEKEYDKAYDDYAEYWVRSRGELTDVTDYEFTALIVTKDGHLGNKSYPYCVFKVTDEENEYEAKYYKRGIRPVIRVKRSEKRKGENAVDTAKVDEFETIVLGTYEQDNNTSNGAEPIEWLVLDKTEDKILVVSKYILDYVEYSNIYDKRVAWFDSSLRAYVNNEFYNSAFNEREKIYISPMKYKTYDNPIYNSIEEKEAIDKIGILGFDECMKYFDIEYDECIKNRKYENITAKSQKLKTSPTAYAKDKFNADKSRYEGANESDFWLRNEGRSGEEKTYKYNSAMSARDTIDFKGSIYDLYVIEAGKTTKSNLKLGFRPMMWLDSQISLLP